MKKPTLSLLPLYSTLAATDRELVCMVRVAAPKVREQAPLPLNLAIVIDASPSMQSHMPGAPCPLDEVKKAARRLVDRLGDTDRVALVGYSDQARVLHESAPLGGCREILAQRIDAIGVMGSSTNLHAGWLAGAGAVAPHAAEGVISRVCLLSDGQANCGVTQTEALALAAERLNQEGGVSTSTYGIGQMFNEQLMTAMAVSGGGLAFYAEDASAMAGYFENESALLRATVGRRLVARVTARAGKHDLAVEWLNGAAADGGRRLSDLAAGAISWALLRLNVPRLGKTGHIEIAGEVTWDDEDGQHAAACTCTVKVGARHGGKNEEVAERAKEVEAAAIQRKAAEDARRGDWQGVGAHLSTLRGMAGDNAYINSVSETLLACASARNVQGFSKEATYASNSMSTRQVGVQESATTLGADPFGLRKAVQGRNAEAQDKKGEAQA